MLTSFLSSALLIVSAACSDDEAAAPNGGKEDAGNEEGDGSTSGDRDGGDDLDGSSDKDANSDALVQSDASACVFAPPLLDGGGPCGTIPFGKPAVAFVKKDSPAYDGGVLAPGIYDVVAADRSSAIPGSWRETIVVDDTGHYTRVREIDQTGKGGGGVRYWSGTVSTASDKVTFAASCQVYADGGTGGAANDSFDYGTDGKLCAGGSFDYGVLGIRVKLVRR